MKPFVRSLIAIGSLGAITVVSGSALAEENTGVATDMLECPKTGQQPQGAARSEAHGFVQLIDEALAHANLDENQARALSQIAHSVDAKTGAVHEAKRNLMLSLAEQMESGRVDRQALEREVEALAQARESAAPAMRNALEKIHQTLNSDQRKSFADALEQSVQQRMQMAKSGHLLDQWTQELQLNDQQKQKVQSILNQLKPTMDQHEKAFNRVISAFRGQSFNIEQIVPSRDAAQEARQGAEQVVNIAEQIAQVLTPQQRALAARKIVQNACPKVAPQQTGAPTTHPQTGHQSQQLEGENIGTAEDELIIGRRGLWGGYGRGYFRGVNRFGRFWSPGFGYYGGAYPYAYSYGYPGAYGLGAYGAYGAYRGFGGGFWPGATAYSYSYPYMGGYSMFW